MRQLRCAVGAIVLWAFHLSASAHHTFAPEYERYERGTVAGTVLSVAYANPHVAVIIAVTDRAGVVTRWSANTVGPNGLGRRGWLKETIQVDDYIVVEGFMGRDGASRVWIQSIELETGATLYPVGREP